MPETTAREHFVEFVLARRSHLVRLSRALSAGTVEDAEDDVQEALVRLAARWRNVRDPESYVRKMLVNLAHDRGRRSRSRPLPATGAGDAETAAGVASDHAGAVVAADEVHAALAGLPLRQRQVLVLRYLSGCADAEIASLLNCGIGTVKNSGFKGLRTLRARLEQPSMAAVAASKENRDSVDD
jgi:RNA polymerase sigma factor (sigma-70 family)